MNTPIQDMQANAVKLSELCDIMSTGFDIDWKYYSLDDAIKAYIKAYDLSKKMFNTQSLEALYGAIKDFSENKEITESKMRQEEKWRIEDDEIEADIY